MGFGALARQKNLEDVDDRESPRCSDLRPSSYALVLEVSLNSERTSVGGILTWRNSVPRQATRRGSTTSRLPPIEIRAGVRGFPQFQKRHRVSGKFPTWKNSTPSCAASRGMWWMMARRTRQCLSAASSAIAGSRLCARRSMPITAFTCGRRCRVLELRFVAGSAVKSLQKPRCNSNIDPSSGFCFFPGFRHPRSSAGNILMHKMRRRAPGIQVKPICRSH